MVINVVCLRKKYLTFYSLVTPVNVNFPRHHYS